MGILLDSCNFVELCPEVVFSCKRFSCEKDADIESFFKSEYADYSSQLLGKSYAFVTDSVETELVCAFTLSNSSVSADRLTNNQRNRLNRNIPNAKRRRQYPAVLIGQLAVFDGFSGKRIGDELLDFIKALILNPEIKSGCRYLLVDAINTFKVIDFYERNGFKMLFASDSEELSYLGKESDSTRKLKTRLMYFDLIQLRG